MPEVTAILTNWTSKVGFARDIYNALVRLGLPSQAAALLTAHSSLSTGWGKSVYNWNLTGIKLCSGCEGTYDYVIKPGSEVINGVETARTPMKWRAFASLDDGVARWWQVLQNSRYNSARALLMAGDTEYFAEVGRNGWYTASPAQMKAEMTGRLDYIVQVLDLSLESSASGGGFLLGLLGGILALWIKRK